MFEGLFKHGYNSTDYPETTRRPSLPKLTLLERWESLQGLSEHGNNSKDYAETTRSASLPKLTPLEKCES